MDIEKLRPLSDEDLAAEFGIALPGKELISLLDLVVNLDLGLDLAAPVDLAVAANVNVGAPVDAAVGANILSVGSTVVDLAEQKVTIAQHLSDVKAIAEGVQGSDIDQGNDVPDTGTRPATPADTTVSPVQTSTGVSALPGLDISLPSIPGLPTTPAIPAVPDMGNILTGDLLNVDVHVTIDADLVAPINGAVAANGNIAAPIDAAVGANVGSVNSEATAIARQTADIVQDMSDVVADADANQTSDIIQ